MRTQPRIEFDREHLETLCRRHGIRRLALFGSALSGELGPDSDIDLLVEFEPGRWPGLLALAAMEAELSAYVSPRRVDLRTARDLSRYFRDRVIRIAELQHARG